MEIVVDRHSLDVVITVDPAISERSTACRSAITVGGITPYNKIFLLDYWVGRQGDPAKLIDETLRLAYEWQPRLIGIEMVGYQQALRPYMERAMMQYNRFYQVIPLKPDRNEKKEQRILSMQPYFRAGQIYILEGMLEFIEEYETFPLGQTCDILDAFAYAVRLLVPQQPSRVPGLELELKMLAKKDPMSARYWRADAVKRGLIDAQPTIDDVLEEPDERPTEVGIGEFL